MPTIHHPYFEACFTADSLTVQQALERLILATPSGEVRNALCDANILMLQAMDDYRRSATPAKP